MASICPNENCPDVRETGLAGVYGDEMAQCPTCGTTLRAVALDSVDSGAPSGPHLEVPAWDTVGFVADRNLLPVMRSVLQAAGIPFVIRNEFDQFASVYGAVASKLGLKVAAPAIAVPSERVEEARALLTTPAEWDDEAATSEPDPAS